MAKSSSPPTLFDSSAPSSSHERAKSLGLGHDSSLRQRATLTRALTPDPDQALDSANFEAAKRLLQSRLDAGLTQEAVAARVGADAKTIGQRERNKVDLGPLRQLVLVERALKARAK